MVEELEAINDESYSLYYYNWVCKGCESPCRLRVEVPMKRDMSEPPARPKHCMFIEKNTTKWELHNCGIYS